MASGQASFEKVTATISKPCRSAAGTHASQYSAPLRLTPCCTMTTGLSGVVASRPEALQHQRPVGTVAVEVGDARATWLHQRSRKVVRAHHSLSREMGGTR